MPADSTFGFPTSIRFGNGIISKLAGFCKKAGMERPLLVTDPGLAGLPMVEKIVAEVKEADLDIKVFSNIKPNPIAENISDGVAAYKDGNHDGVIAFGGGSGLDAGKVIAFMQGQTRPIFDYEDVGNWWTRADSDTIAPIIAVPTTAGTGSEVGRAGLITDGETHAKKIIFHPLMMPAYAILDPELTVGLPPNMTAATGLDALSHNLEAWCAPRYHPFAAGIALEGMRLVKDFLPNAVAYPTDLEARGQMLVASAMGATAFQRGLGAMHALAHPLGGMYDAHHGMLNAILMPYVLKANRVAIENRMKRAAKYMYIKDGFDGFLNWVLELREGLEIPHDLAAIGIPGDDLATIGEMATKDPSAGGNPIQFTAEQYTQIVTDAHKGTL